MHGMRVQARVGPICRGGVTLMTWRCHMKRLVAALVLASLVAGPALAQRFDSPSSNPESTQASPSRGENQIGAGNRDAIIDKGRVIGRDPDPWIRNEILRHSHSGWPD